MYAIAFEAKVKGKWVARLEYTHATNAHEAKRTWAGGMPKKMRMDFNVRLVGIAPVIGVFVDNEKKGVYTV